MKRGKGRRALATPPHCANNPEPIVPKPKEHPITFSSKEAALIRAILDGTKTQTRRVSRRMLLLYCPPVVWTDIASEE